MDHLGFFVVDGAVCGLLGSLIIYFGLHRFLGFDVRVRNLLFTGIFIYAIPNYAMRITAPDSLYGQESHLLLLLDTAISIAITLALVPYLKK